MCLFHWRPHPDQKVPTFEDIARAFGGGSFAIQAMVAAALALRVAMIVPEVMLNHHHVGTLRAAQAVPSKRQAGMQRMSGGRAVWPALFMA